MTNEEPIYKPLPIVINGIEFKPNAEGKYNLTDMHKRLCLPKAKIPSQWRTAIAKAYLRDANLHLKHGKGSDALASEEVTIAYAMWVNSEFYSLVVNTFIAVRNNALATALVASQLEEKHRILLKNNSRIVDRFHKWVSADKLNWQKTALICGIEKPTKARCSFIEKGYINYYHTNLVTNGIKKRVTNYYPTEKGKARGIGSVNMGLQGEQLTFNVSARNWLSRVIDDVNKHAASIKVKAFNL